MFTQTKTNKMYTAEELIDSVLYMDNFEKTCIDGKDVKRLMIEFAKLHVEAALESASENVCAYMDGPSPEVSKNSILTAYPESNIQ